jgi:hypothetical protein
MRKYIKITLILVLTTLLSNVNVEGAPLAEGLTPILSLKNYGNSKARDAFLTQLWAARTKDIKTTSAVITFGPEARKAMQEVLNKMPSRLKSICNTPELLMAYALTHSHHPVNGESITSEKEVSSTQVILETKWQRIDDDIIHDSTVHVLKLDDGWRVEMSLELVNYVGKMLIERTS